MYFYFWYIARFLAKSSYPWLPLFLHLPINDCHFSYKQKFLLNKNTVANSVIPISSVFFVKGQILAFLGQTKNLWEICLSSLHSTKFLEFLAFGFYSCPNNTSHAPAISVILPVVFLGKCFCPFFFTKCFFGDPFVLL